MKRFTLAVALTCVLSVSAFGGEMPTCSHAAPTPTEETVVTATTAPGEMPTVGAPKQEEEPGILDILLLTIIIWP